MNLVDDVEGWTVESGKGTVSKCSAIKLFGGYDIFGR